MSDSINKLVPRFLGHIVLHWPCHLLARLYCKLHDDMVNLGYTYSISDYMFDYISYV